MWKFCRGFKCENHQLSSNCDPVQKIKRDQKFDLVVRKLHDTGSICNYPKVGKPLIT